MGIAYAKSVNMIHDLYIMEYHSALIERCNPVTKWKNLEDIMLNEMLDLQRQILNDLNYI